VGTHGPRRMAREAALQVLFAADHVHPELEVEAARSAFEEVCEEFKLPRRTHVRALELAVGVARNRKDIDLAIGRASEHWKVDRLAAVDRAVLRIATFELLHERETPTEVPRASGSERCSSHTENSAPGSTITRTRGRSRSTPGDRRKAYKKGGAWFSPATRFLG